ncbi:hypothetical protein ACTGYZ_09415 [Streptococcus suis]
MSRDKRLKEITDILHTKNILRLVVRKSPTGESSHYFFFMLK